MMAKPMPGLCGVIVHWFDEDRLQRLVDAWPQRQDLELIVVDNGSVEALPTAVDTLRPGRNLGFAGAVNAAVDATTAPLVLIMNSDVLPRPGAIDALLRGFDDWPEAAGLAPRLVGALGESQAAWQLRELPSLAQLLLQAMLLPATGEGRSEPAAGAAIEQPAAAALCLRRDALESVGGLDESFYPAWFEDVDLARRLQEAGATLRYCPESVFLHDLGSSVPQLGYASFLPIYYANLVRYLAKHHGRTWAVLARALLIPAALLRLLLLPLRRPRRARSRKEAARGLRRLMIGAFSGWPQAKLPPAPLPPDSDTESRTP